MSAPDEAAASTPPTQQPVPTIDASDPNLTFRDVFEALRRELNPTPALERLLELHGSDAEGLLADTSPTNFEIKDVLSILPKPLRPESLGFLRLFVPHAAHAEALLEEAVVKLIIQDAPSPNVAQAGQKLFLHVHHMHNGRPSVLVLFARAAPVLLPTLAPPCAMPTRFGIALAGVLSSVVPLLGQSSPLRAAALQAMGAVAVQAAAQLGPARKSAGGSSRAARRWSCWRRCSHRIPTRPGPCC